MKNLFTILVVLSMAFSQALFAQPTSPEYNGPVIPTPASVAGATVDLVLSQPNDLGNGLASQDFGDFPTFSSEITDDFIIPPGGSRTIVSYQPFFGSSAGLPVWEGPVIMTVYADAGGVPGAVVFQESFFNPIVNDPLISVNCPPLAPGTYWISAVVDMDFNGGLFGVAFGLTSSQNTAGPGIALWRNPGDGFGNACTDFSPLIACSTIGDEALAFNLELSEEIIEEVAPIPTMGEWGLMVLGIMLLIFGLVAVNQKRSVIPTMAS